jgi:hypothetical protein
MNPHFSGNGYQKNSVQFRECRWKSNDKPFLCSFDICYKSDTFRWSIMQVSFAPKVKKSKNGQSSVCVQNMLMARFHESGLHRI